MGSTKIVHRMKNKKEVFRKNWLEIYMISIFIIYVAVWLISYWNFHSSKN